MYKGKAGPPLPELGPAVGGRDSLTAGAMSAAGPGTGSGSGDAQHSMSLGAGTAVPRASAGSRAARCALWHFINSAGSAPAPLPAPWHPLALAVPGGGELPQQRAPLRGRCQRGRGSPVLPWQAGIFSLLLCATGSEEKANSHLGLPGLGPAPALPHAPVPCSLTHAGQDLSWAMSVCPP